MTVVPGNLVDWSGNDTPLLTGGGQPHAGTAFEAPGGLYSPPGRFLSTGPVHCLVNCRFTPPVPAPTVLCDRSAASRERILNGHNTQRCAACYFGRIPAHLPPLAVVARRTTCARITLSCRLAYGGIRADGMRLVMVLPFLWWSERFRCPTGPHGEAVDPPPSFHWPLGASPRRGCRQDRLRAGRCSAGRQVGRNSLPPKYGFLELCVQRSQHTT